MFSEKERRSNSQNEGKEKNTTGGTLELKGIEGLLTLTPKEKGEKKLEKRRTIISRKTTDEKGGWP